MRRQNTNLARNVKISQKSFHGHRGKMQTCSFVAWLVLKYALRSLVDTLSAVGFDETHEENGNEKEDEAAGNRTGIYDAVLRKSDRLTDVNRD